MSNGDYGYFGKGNTGYAQYMTAFNRNFGGSSGGGGGGGGAAGRACVAGGQCAGGNAAHSGSGGNLQEAFTRDLFHLECSLLFLLSTFSGRKSFFR